MSPLEAILVWITIVALAISSAVYLYSFIFSNERVMRASYYFPMGCFVLLTAAILARYVAVGNLPVAGAYESALGGGWFVILFTMYFSYRNRALSVVGLGTIPFTLILLGIGVMSGPELSPMAASIKSFWLYIHVFFAWLAFGAYAICFGLGIVYLLKERNQGNEFYDKFPSLEQMDETMFRYLVFGFITDAVMIASGTVWAKNLSGIYWSWDPVETWSLVTWLIYGLAIHLRVTLGWRGRRLAWILIFAMGGMVITYFGIDWFVKSSFHVFDVWQEI